VSVRKVKTPAKLFTSDINTLQNIIVRTTDRAASIVGASLGPGGRNIIIESDLVGIPNKNTKDGVSIFRALGANDPYEHLIIEQMRDAAVRTVNEAGDGTTTATVISSALIKNLFTFCGKNRKFSPQKTARIINKILSDKMVPSIRKQSIKVTTKNQQLLGQVAAISANGDQDMAKAVMEAFELTGVTAASHVTIQELSGPSGKYEVKLVEGFPIEKGYEESIGKFHPAFINDQGNQRCTLDKPLFILFDGNITDMLQIQHVVEAIGQEYVNGATDFKNVVIIAHGFSDQVLTTLSFNFPNPNTINIVPLTTPMNQVTNSQLEFLMDVSAFTGAKIFDMTNPLQIALDEESGQPDFSPFGLNMEKIEIYRFRTTIVGEPDELNIEERANQITQRIKQAESKIEKIIFEERLGKLTSGIAQLKVYGSSNAELKEKVDRAEDAVCAVRAAIGHGCLPGGCRTLINLAMEMMVETEHKEIIADVIVPSLFAPFFKLLDNAGYTTEERNEILEKLLDDNKIVYDVENAKFGAAKDLGLYDATLAVEQALKNAVSIASVMGTLGGIIAYPRDGQLEREAASDQMNFDRTIENAEHLRNEANERP
jgi:chaperonin GroEL